MHLSNLNKLIILNDFFKYSAAAALNGKSPFRSGFKKQLDTYTHKMLQAKKSFSDLFAMYHVYKVRQFTVRNEF